MPVLLRQGVGIVEKAIKGRIWERWYNILPHPLKFERRDLVISCFGPLFQTGEYTLVYVKGLYFRGCDTEPYQILLPVPFHLWTPPHWLACVCRGLPLFHHRFTQNLEMSVCLVVLGTSGRPLWFAILSAPKNSPRYPRCAHNAQLRQLNDGRKGAGLNVLRQAHAHKARGVLTILYCL